MKAELDTQDETKSSHRLFSDALERALCIRHRISCSAERKK